jgi:hypothetical protein
MYLISILIILIKGVNSTKLFCGDQSFYEICHFGEKVDPLCCRLEAPIVAMSPAEGQKGRDCWAVDYSENRNPLKNCPSSFKTQMLSRTRQQYIFKIKIHHRTRREY